MTIRMARRIAERPGPIAKIFADVYKYVPVAMLDEFYTDLILLYDRGYTDGENNKEKLSATARVG